QFCDRHFYTCRGDGTADDALGARRHPWTYGTTSPYSHVCTHIPGFRNTLEAAVTFGAAFGCQKHDIFPEIPRHSYPITPFYGSFAECRRYVYPLSHAALAT